MITNGEITLYHAETDRNTRQEIFRRSFFPCCCVYQTVSAEKRHSRSGPWRERDTVIRIPTCEAITLTVGDRVVLGECTAAEPPAESLQVSGVADNRRGSGAVRHWRVVCR